MNDAASDWPFQSDRRRAMTVWRRDDGLTAAPRRWSRKREPWEEEAEPFAGATALGDLRASRGDLTAIRRVLARYSVLHYLERALAGSASDQMALERESAAEYVRRGWSANHIGRRALELVVWRAPWAGVPDLCKWLRIAAEEAAHDRHDGSARALCRTAYGLALGNGCLKEAAEAATSMALLAEAGGGRHATRLWQRRARVIARAADRRRIR